MDKSKVMVKWILKVDGESKEQIESFKYLSAQLNQSGCNDQVG